MIAKKHTYSLTQSTLCFHKAKVFLFLVLQTFSIVKAGGGRKIRNKIVNFQHIFIFERV